MTQPATTNPDQAPLDSEVLRRHGLRHQPFAPKLADRFVYSDPALDMPVGVLLQRLQTDDKPMLLLGEPGVGKSTQLVQLLSRGAAALSFCAFKGRPGATFASIEHAIRQQWGKAAVPETQEPGGADATTQAEEKTSLAVILLAVVRADRRPVLVIDDAHLLAPAVIGALLRLRREVNRHSSNALGIVLAGEPVLNELVSGAHGSEIPSEAFGVIRLRPLMESQTEAYLRHRLQAAGAADPSLLAGETARAIHRESGGLPEAINRAANQHLQELVPAESAPMASQLYGAGAALIETPQARSYWVVPAAAGAFGVLIGALFASLFFLADNGVTESDPASPERQAAFGDVRPEPIPLPIATGPAIPGYEPALSFPEMDAPLPTETASPPQTDTPDTAYPVSEETPIAAAAPLENATPPTDETPPEPPAQESAPTEAATAPATPPAEETVEPPEPIAMEPPLPAVAPDPAAAMGRAASDTGPVETADADPGSERAATPASPPAPAGPRGPDWVRERPPEQFTIQIIAGADLEALQRFARRVSMETDVAWVRTRRGEQDWYALVTGEYPDLASAQAAATRLPAPVRRNQPWIRTFGSVQQAMQPSP